MPLANAAAGTEASPRPASAATISRIDVVSDAICPWCWIGKRHLESALARLADAGEGFEVHWRPFQLNPDMPREGVERAAYRAAKFGSLERSRELDAQVAAAGAAAGLEFRLDRQRRTPNTVDAHRLIRRAGEAGGAARQDAVVERLFRAYFQDGHDIGDRAVLAEVAAEAGLEDAASFLASDEGDAEVEAEDSGLPPGSASPACRASRSRATSCSPARCRPSAWRRRSGARWTSSAPAARGRLSRSRALRSRRTRRPSRSCTPPWRASRRAPRSPPPRRSARPVSCSACSRSARRSSA